MEYVRTTTLKTSSRLCFGCEQLGGMDWGDVDIAELSTTIAEAFERGVNFFDTAGIYGLGRSEERLSEALGSQRTRAFIATKGGLIANASEEGQRATVTRNASPGALRLAVDESLQRLRLNSLPVFYVHWPDPDTSIMETVSALCELRDEGKIERIGLSNFDHSHIQLAASIGRIDVVQIQASLIHRPDMATLEFCDKNGIAVCAYGVLAQGLLTGKYSAGSTFSQEDRRHRLSQFSKDNLEWNLRTVDRLREVATEIGRTPTQVAIRFILQLSGVTAVVVGIKSRLQLEGAFGAFDWQLSPKHVHYLNSSES